MAGSLDFGAGAVAVFGGSGGIGAGICRSFAAAGCDVAFTYFAGLHRAEPLEAELKESGVAVSKHRVDVTDAEEVQSAVSEMLKRHGALHTIVFASGVEVLNFKLADLTPERLQYCVNAELIGFFNVFKATLPELRRNCGNIVACVTCANQRVIAADAESAIPKGGVESLVRQIAFEEGVNNIRANAVTVGWINAGQGSLDPNADRSLISKGIGPETIEYLAKTVPLGRPGTNAEFAAAVLFMASRQASYITGQNLSVDGGFAL